jgi:hypothetical protein
VAGGFTVLLEDGVEGSAHLFDVLCRAGVEGVLHDRILGAGCAPEGPL